MRAALTQVEPLGTNRMRLRVMTDGREKCQEAFPGFQASLRLAKRFETRLLGFRA